MTQNDIIYCVGTLTGTGRDNNKIFRTEPSTESDVRVKLLDALCEDVDLGAAGLGVPVDWDPNVFSSQLQYLIMGERSDGKLKIVDFGYVTCTRGNYFLRSVGAECLERINEDL